LWLSFQCAVSSSALCQTNLCKLIANVLTVSYGFSNKLGYQISSDQLFWYLNIQSHSIVSDLISIYIKVQSPLCTRWRQVRYGGAAAVSLKVDTRWVWVVSFTPYQI
jgi:hypothetical protein